MFGTVAGIMMALFLDNVGGAWDNAKKYVEVSLTTRKRAESQKMSDSCLLKRKLGRICFSRTRALNTQQNQDWIRSSGCQ